MGAPSPSGGSCGTEEEPSTSLISVDMAISNTLPCFITRHCPGKLHLYSSCNGLHTNKGLQAVQPCTHCLMIRRDADARAKLARQAAGAASSAAPSM